MDYEPVIGLEVHAQLRTESKIFCSCSTRFGAPPNSQTCPTCAGMPGVLPVLNRRAVEYALRMALATHCSIRPVSRFARKNYFYPDLPKGYQISQFEEPLCEDGYLEIEIDGVRKRIRLNRIHLEEDAGKNLHDQDPQASLIDLNRCGTPLIEIVSEPDMREPREAAAYLAKLKQTLVYLEICDGNMEEGSLRCDANVSIRPVGTTAFGTRTEIKNLNSFKGVEAALRYEIERQTQILEQGGRVIQETRLWDAEKAETRAMRSKEEAHDYRYFPEPDLLPLRIDEAWLAEIQAQMPELPEAKRSRFESSWGLSSYDATVLTATRALADYYETAVATGGEPKKVANWVMGELLAVLNQRGLEIESSPISPQRLSELVRLISDGTISGTMGKEIFALMVEGEDSPMQIVKRLGMTQIDDAAHLLPLIEEVVAAHPVELEKYRAGKTQLLGFFVGQVMKATHGRANPNELNRLLRKILDESG